MLQLDGLVLRQGAFVVRADLTIPVGRTVAVIGPSGAGKSTLIGAIAGFVDPEQGRIFWNGADITQTAPGARPVAMLFQNGNLFPHLTLAQNIGLGLRPDLRLSQAQKAEVTGALDRVGLAGLAGRRPAQVSGGQQSRAALARVLVQRRPLLLLDEPFSALGPALRDEMLDLVAALASETRATLLMVSHDPKDARKIAVQVLLVADGVAHPPEPTAQVLDTPPPALKAYLG